MIKNQANIYRFVIVDSIGQGLTGLTPSITLAKDSATTFTAATNSPSEVSSADAPGLYEIALTATECNCDTLTIRVTLPTGQAPAILDVVQMEGASGGGATPQEIWEYTGGRTVTNTIPTAADNAAAVWGATSRTLTNLDIQSELTTYGAAKTTDLTGLATSQDITNSQAVIIGAMPTTAGLATTSDVTTAQAAIIAAMPDVSNLATTTDLSNAEDTIIGNIVSAMPDISGLSTFDASTDTVTIDATQAAGMATATGFATPTNITDAVTALETYGDGKWLTADVSELATSTELANTQEDIISAMPTADITAIKAGLYNWELVKDGTTESITAKNGSSTVAQSTITRNSAGEIIKMEETE